MGNSEKGKGGETLRWSVDDIFPELHDANMRFILEIIPMKILFRPKPACTDILILDNDVCKNDWTTYFVVSV